MLLLNDLPVSVVKKKKQQSVEGRTENRASWNKDFHKANF